MTYNKDLTFEGWKKLGDGARRAYSTDVIVDIVHSLSEIGVHIPNDVYLRCCEVVFKRLTVDAIHRATWAREQPMRARVLLRVEGWVFGKMSVSHEDRQAWKKRWQHLAQMRTTLGRDPDISFGEAACRARAVIALTAKWPRTVKKVAQGQPEDYGVVPRVLTEVCGCGKHRIERGEDKYEAHRRFVSGQADSPEQVSSEEPQTALVGAAETMTAVREFIERRSVLLTPVDEQWGEEFADAWGGDS